MGRPPKRINLSLIERLAGLGCTDAELAFACKVSVRTIESRRASSMSFNNACERGRAKVRLSLRRKQLQLALNGNVTMLVWLGKVLCLQKPPIHIVAPEGLPMQPDRAPVVTDDTYLASVLNALQEAHVALDPIMPPGDDDTVH